MASKKKIEPEKIQGKKCPDCGEKYEEPNGWPSWRRQNSEDYDLVVHDDVRDCVRHINKRFEKHYHGISEHSHTESPND